MSGLSEQRNYRVTASNAGAILGVDPNRTACDVMRAMVRHYVGAEKEIDDFTENVIFAYGKFNECGAITEYIIESGKQVVMPSSVVDHGFFMYEHWLGATPDALVINMFGDIDHLVEIKSPYGKRNDDTPIFKKINNNELPHYYAQTQIQMLCTNTEKCDFYQWAPKKTSLETVYKNNNWLSVNLPKLREFYEKYIYEREHNVDEYLQPKRAELDTADAQKLINEFDELSESIELAAERKKDILRALANMCGNKNATICGRALTLVEKQGQISYAKAIKDLLPDVDLEKYRGKPSEYWLLK